MFRSISGVTAAALATTMLSPAAFAQPSSPVAADAAGPSSDAAAVAEDDVAVAEIIVTAQKRSESIQDAPIAISAIGGEALAEQQIADFQGLATYIPNVNFGSSIGFGRIAIRGLGTDTSNPGQEGRVAYHLDGVYIARLYATLSGLFDVDRVEIVRGPQGTLYGRNATGGAVNVITRNPTDELEGYGRLTVGNYGLVSTEAAISGPLADGVSARVAFRSTDHDGYGKNFFTGTGNDDAHVRSARAKLRLEPGSDWDIVLAADYHRERDHNYQYLFFGPSRDDFVPFFGLDATRAPDPRDSNEETPSRNRREIYGFTGTANWDPGFAELTSITAYRNSKRRWSSDQDKTEVVLSKFSQIENAEQFSQEVRLAGDFERGTWIVGGYYFHEKVFGDVRVSPLSNLMLSAFLSRPGTDVLLFGPNLTGTLRTNAYAAFGEVQYELVPSLTLTVGGRYSEEKKSIDEGSTAGIDTRPFVPTGAPLLRAFQKDSSTDRNFSPRVVLEYQPNDSITAYATYAKGFKSGGYSVGSVQPPFFPEKLTDYEVGVKTEWLNRRIRANAAAFYYDYTDLQVQKVTGTSSLFLNAAEATVKGLELEVVALPTRELELTFNGSLLDSEFDELATADPARPELGVLDLAGNKLTQAPDYKFTVGVAYTIPTADGSLRLSADATWVDRVYFSIFNRDIVSAPAHATYNAFARYENETGGWSLSAFIKNIANKDVISSAFVSSNFHGYPLQGTYEPPRTFGVEFGYRF